MPRGHPGTLPRRRPIPHERDVKDPCKYQNRATGVPCRNPALPGALVCQAHLRTFLAHGEQKFVKCRDCFLVAPHLGKDGLITNEVMEAVKQDCGQAFWVSKGKPEKLRKDICYWDTQSLLNPVDTPEDALVELKAIIEDLKLRKSQMERVLAKEGGEMTPMYLQVTDRLTHLLKDYVELKRGKQAFGRPGSLDGGLADAQERARFLKDLVDAKDGYEDGIRLEETRTLSVKREDGKPRVVRLEPAKETQDPEDE